MTSSMSLVLPIDPKINDKAATIARDLNEVSVEPQQFKRGDKPRPLLCHRGGKPELVSTGMQIPQGDVLGQCLLRVF